MNIKRRMKKLRQIRYIFVIVSILTAIALVVFGLFWQLDVIIAASVFLVMFITGLFVVLNFEKVRKETSAEIESNLDQGSKEALNFADVGVLVYNEEFIITWLSSLFSFCIIV